MKACIIAFANLRVTPYINNYIDLMKKNNIDFDIILWNRELAEEKEIDGCTIYSYNKRQDETRNLLVKVIPMLSYGAFVKKVLRKNKYDTVIVLTSLLGVLLESYLSKKYLKRYIFDIRDYSYEHIKWYYNKMDSLMKNSALNVISSKEFMTFLPKRKYRVIHNCNFEEIPQNAFKKKTGALRIEFVGVIRYFSECKKLLDKIKNNNRFIFSFHGSGSDAEKIQNYCIDEDIKNVEFHGRYSPSEKAEIIEHSDFIFNAYGNDRIEIRYALSNKYYDSIYYKKPLIVNPDTTMAEASKGIAFECDYEGDTASKLLKWYDDIDENEFNRICEDYLKKAIEENKETEKEILRVLLNNLTR